MTVEENSSQRETISQTPTLTTRTFVSPGVVPMEPLPSIKVMFGGATSQPETPAPVPESSPTPTPEPAPEEPEPEEKPVVPDEFNPEEIEYEEPKDEENDSDDEDDEATYETDSPETSVDVPSEDAPVEEGNDFAICWRQLFETLFNGNHLIYYSLKDETPRYENDVIYVEVKNGIQKELIETNKTSILEYWRNHFTLNVDDLEVLVNEQKESKKVIVNSEDKMRNMVEQNGQLMDFLNILKFNIKD